MAPVLDYNIATMCQLLELNTILIDAKTDAISGLTKNR